MKSITTTRYYPASYLIKLSFIFATTVVLVLLLPQQLFAYSTTEQSAIQLTEDTFLFQITYRFNFMNRASEHPFLTARTDAAITDYADRVQYSMVDEGGAVIEGGAVASIVLAADTEATDDHYPLDERETGLFTLVSLVKLTPEQLAAGGSAAIEVNWLPFTLINTDEDDERTAARVPDTNLADFITPAITWQPTPIASQTHTLTNPTSTTPALPTTWK